MAVYGVPYMPVRVEHIMDELDRAIVNLLQGGFPICAHPFAEVAASLHTSEQEIISRVGLLLKQGTLSRFGPYTAVIHTPYEKSVYP